MAINKKNTEEFTNMSERLVCLTACLVIVAPSVISLFNSIIRAFITLPFKMDTLFIYLVFLLIFLFSLKTILNRSTPLIYVVISLLLFGYLITFMFNSYYYEYFTNLGVDFLIVSVPWLIVTYAVRDYKIFKKYLYISIVIVMVSFMVNLFVFGVEMLGGYTYTQQYTYMLLPVAIILLDAIYDKKSVINITLFLVSIIFMFSMGARGPLVCVILYMLLKNYVTFNFNLKKAVLNSGLLTLILVPLYVFFQDIISYLFTLFQNMNLSTRTIVRLMESSFFEDNARNLLTKYSIDLIKEYPLIGVGMGKDRMLLADKMGSTNLLAEAVGWYPHNIFLEILLHFGVFIGGAVILLMIRVIYISTFKSNNKDVTDITCIFIGIGFFPLFLAGSYITSPLFFALMGICLYQYKHIRAGRKKLISISF
ncbi:MAG: hypothetical protein KGZ96_09360 [Clostridia bacterium]|nr:hypothetical protein [Clostridia bacterium]